MANSPQAKKRARQNDKRKAHNATLRSNMRTHVKKIVNAIEAKDTETAKQAYQVAVPVLDRMARLGIIHKNKAARHKSRLNAKIKALVLGE